MRLHYKNYLNQYAKKLRKGGNLSEVLLWNELKRNKLGYRFLRQRPIGKYIVDFYCHSLNMVIEVDGAATHDFKIEADKSRQKDLELIGIKIVRFGDADARYNLEGVVNSIKTEILRLAKIPRPSDTPFRKGGILPSPLRKEERNPPDLL